MPELFIELQCEELPAGMVRPALKGLQKGLLELLEGIEHGAVRTWATPRRLAIAVDDVIVQRPLVQTVVTGPPADRAFKDGEPTKAAIGFARGKGVHVADLQVIDGRVAATVTEGGEKTAEVVSAGLDGLVRGVPFDKSMIWADGTTPRFGRPLHRVNAVFDGQALSGTAAGVAVGNTTVGHRLAEVTAFSFASSAEWAAGLAERSVDPDLDHRKQAIRELLVQAAQTLGSDPIVDDALLEEVTHLVECPVLILGAFDEELLELPPRLLVETMKVHQRYFPVFRDGELTNHFVVIGNNPWADHDIVAEGNARVLRPRFYDARFFFAEDKKQTLDAHGEGLERMRWIRGLGKMSQRQDRVAALSAVIAQTVGADPGIAGRAGQLCKSDLPTQMVGEFPKLQGHMGRLFAAHQGEDAAVALAIEEHYLPRYAGDAVASSAAGAAVALADRFDTLAGCFGIGLRPKGGDPQGLRRAALGVVVTLVERGIRADLRALFTQALANVHSSAGAEGFEAWNKARGTGPAPADVGAVARELVDFTLARFKAWKTAQKVSGDLVDAVLSASAPDPVVLAAKVDALAAISKTPEFKPIMHTFKRVLNISRGHDFPSPDPAAFTEPAEHALAEAVSQVEDSVREAVARLDFPAALEGCLRLQGPVAAFFDDVLVDHEDPAIKAVRMGLLLRVSRLFLQVADFSRISTR